MSYALRDDGTVWGWGLNSTGQVGDGTTTTRTSRSGSGRSPASRRSPPGATTASPSQRRHALGLGRQHAGPGRRRHPHEPAEPGARQRADRRHPSRCRRRTTRSPSSPAARCGPGARTTSASSATARRPAAPTPVAVPGITGATCVAAGRQHSLAVVAGGALRAWGSNANGQLGDGTTTDRRSPVVVNGITGATEASAGWGHTRRPRAARRPRPPHRRASPRHDAAVDAGGADRVEPVDVVDQPQLGRLDRRRQLDVDLPRVRGLGHEPGRDATSASTTTVSYTRTGLAAGSTHTLLGAGRRCRRQRRRRRRGRRRRSPCSRPRRRSSPTTSRTGGFRELDDHRRPHHRRHPGFAVGAERQGARRPGVRAFAARNLGSTLRSICHSQRVRDRSVSGSADLFRLRTAADGPVSRLTSTPAGCCGSAPTSPARNARSGVTLPSTRGGRSSSAAPSAPPGRGRSTSTATQVVTDWVADTGTVAGRSGPDRRHRQQDLEHPLRRRAGRSDAGLTGRRPSGGDEPGRRARS